MKKIAILVPQHAVIQAVADPQYCFSAANLFCERQGKSPIFDIHLVGEFSSVEVASGLYTVHCNAVISADTTYDLIIIPALFGDLNEAIRANENLVEWLKLQYARGAELASLCLGAFLLAKTGLLAGKACSTHWGFQEDLRLMFPDLNVQHGLIVTEENGIYTSGGANSYWNLLLHIVEKFADRSLAILLSKYFAVDYSRQDQSVFAMFRGLRSHGDDIILRAQNIIERDVKAPISIDELTEQLAIGRRSFERRFRQATHHSALEYIQRIKIEQAKREMENTRKSISEIMHETGYGDAKSFRTIFRKWTGLTPMEYRERYGKKATLLGTE
jgi:transcriptional regulator GlxA family with amidase domain